MPKTRIRLAVILAVFALPACGGQGQKPQSAAPAAPATEITIENNSFSTVDVFIVYNDQTFRVDQVFGVSTATVRMPRFVAPTGSIRALVDPLGSTYAYLSDPVSYLGNENFRLRIEEDLALSSFVPVGRQE
jgi:hypothetical protein